MFAPNEVLNQDLLGIGCGSLFDLYLGGLQLRFRRERALAHFERPESRPSMSSSGGLSKICWHGEYSSPEDFHKDITGVEEE